MRMSILPKDCASNANGDASYSERKAGICLMGIATLNSSYMLNTDVVIKLDPAVATAFIVTTPSS